MLAASNGHLWLLSTPDGKQGFFYDAWANGGAGWARFRVPATLCPASPRLSSTRSAAPLPNRCFNRSTYANSATRAPSSFPLIFSKRRLPAMSNPFSPADAVACLDEP
jgi:hypothetical protein